MHDTMTTPCQEPCPDCDIGPFARNNYFTGKLLVERDFKDEQTYYVDKLRHHDQTLHGWGVVCGLEVTPHENPACRAHYICVEPGTAIDCCGHEILVRERDCIDIRRLPAHQSLVDGGGRTRRLQVCIRYRECPTEQVPVLYDECGCDDTKCAPNRILESYEIDLLVDPDLPARTRRAPAFAWRNTVGIAHARQVALHEGTQRLYVLNTDGAVFPVRTDNHSVLTPLATASPVLAIAVSNDGTRLYAAIGPNDRSILVFDTADLAAGPIRTLAPIAASAGSDIELAVAPEPSGRLLALLSAPGRVLAYQTDINSSVGMAVAPDDITLSPNLRSLAISSDGARAYAVDRPGRRIQVANLTPPAPGAAITVPGNPDLYAVAVLRSTAPDVLVTVAQTERALHLLTSTPRSIALAYPPEAITMSPEGNWAYVLERNGAEAYLQVVNVFALSQGQTVPPGDPFRVGDASTGSVITSSGARLYVPYIGDSAVAGDGGVAIVDITDTDCIDFQRDCPACDTANCVVLATIENYNLNGRFEAQTDPPADPVQDTAAGIVRIDNRTGRRLLPSTQALADALVCIMERTGRGAPGPQGPPGPPGPDGQPGADGAPGLGLNPNLPKIIDIGWVHAGTFPFLQFFQSSLYDNHPSEILQPGRPLPLLAVYFNQPIIQGINRQTFRVSVEYPELIPPIFPTPVPAPPTFGGTYNRGKVDIYGYILDLGARPTPHTGEIAPSTFAFVPYREFFDRGPWREFWVGQTYPTNPNFPDLRLDLPVLRLVLKGDFIFAGMVFAEGGVLDADNIGGNVGRNIARQPPILGGLNPSGNLTQGGDFESWFFLEQPQANPDSSFPPDPNFLRRSISTGGPPGLVDVNTASAVDLRRLPGLTDAAVKRIMKARETGGFTDLEDFRARAKLTGEQLEAIRDLVAPVYFDRGKEK